MADTDSETSSAKQDHMGDLYDRLHDSPAQQKFRRIRPWPVGCVFIQHPAMTDDDIRGHFRLMRELGFTALKQCQVCRGTDQRKVMHMALDEGIIPWWYGEAGWEDPTPGLLTELGLPDEMPIEELRENDTWVARQEKIMRERIDGADHTHMGASRQTPLDDMETPEVPGVQLTFNYELTEAHQPYFMDWLKTHYGDIDSLNEAWNVHHCMIAGPSRESGELNAGTAWESWDQLAADVLDIVNSERREYRRIRDVLRFKADIYLQHVRAKAHETYLADRNVPSRAGGEMGLFLPFASRGTDMEGIAEVMKDYGSFYPSFHLAWHFEEVDFETVRPMYMQSSITTDWFKGGWNASWEATGGPQQMTGHKAPFVPKVRDKTPGFTVDEGIMRQLMLSWIAGGYRGFGLWCWNGRTAGWEAGEFALLDRNGRTTGRAVVAGKIGKACRRYRDELWQAHKEPLVGVFQDWDMEAIWAAAAMGGRDHFKSEPIRARIGAARALINANVPWEHVTGSDLQNGLATRYKAIILPAALALSEELLDILHGYVTQGGRVVLDAPGAWFDYYGRLLSTDDETPFERLFGCRVADYQYSREDNRPWRIEGRRVQGCTFDLQPTRARVLQAFDTGKSAITEHSLGKGAAILVGYEATLACTEPGHVEDEQLLVTQLIADIPLPYACETIAYRLCAPEADHYFLMNDGEARAVQLEARDAAYTAASDPVTGEEIDLTTRIQLDAHSARWIRFEKVGDDRR